MTESVCASHQWEVASKDQHGRFTELRCVECPAVMGIDWAEEPPRVTNRTYHHAIRCGMCDGISKVDGHDASFYNSFGSLRVCKHCGRRTYFYDATVYWQPAKKTLNPLTWGASGQWIVVPEDEE